jgi:hypothetical protein
MFTVPTFKFVGPFWMLTSRFTVPAAVPVNKVIGDEKTAVVVFAGIVKFAVLDPVEN